MDFDSDGVRLHYEVHGPEGGAPLVEVHISNISGREDFRHQSVITGSATGIIAGFGFQSYVLALHAIKAELDKG